MNNNNNNYTSYSHYNEAPIGPSIGNPATEVLRIDQLVHQDDWVCDSERYRCHVCTRNFNSFRRKHHCRRCGEVVCRNCTLYKEAELPVIGRSRVRICMSCILAHANSYHQAQTQGQTQGQTPGQMTQNNPNQLQEIQRGSGNRINDPYSVSMLSPRGGSAGGSGGNNNNNNNNNNIRNTGAQNTRVSNYPSGPGSMPNSAKTKGIGGVGPTRNLHVQTTQQQKAQPNTWIHSPTKDQSSDHESDGISHTINNSSSLRDLPQQLSFDYPLDYTWEHPWPKPPIVPNDEERIQVLKSFEIMDTPQEDVFDIICELASNALKCPIAAVSLIDDERQWFKASIGIAQAEIPRGVSFCAHTIMSKEPLYILDTTKDIRFEHNPLVTGPAGIRFYGGAPICASTGHVVGTVFVFDTKPHDSCDVATLEKLSNVAMKNLEDRKNSIVSPIVSRGGAMTRNARSASKGKRDPNTYTNDQLKETEQQLVAASTTPNQVTVTGGNGASSEQQIVSGAKMESMLMDLLCRTTETQQQLATQQGAIFHTLGQHTDQIDKLANAVARMEAKLDDLESDYTVRNKSAS